MCGELRETKFVLGIAGMPGAGKDTVIKLLSKQTHLHVIILREIVEAELKEKGIPVNNRTLREFATELRKQFGRDIIAKKCLPLLKKALETNNVVVLNAIKAVEEVEYLKNELQCPFFLIAVHSSPMTRFKRLSKRGLAWDMKDWESFRWRDKVELSWGAGEAMALADYVIINDSTFQDLETQVSHVWKSILRALSSGRDFHC
jgi:dephospho-CoA kinase